MKTDFSKWLSIIARFALVAVIAFLAYELHQNNQLLRKQAEYTHVRNKMEGNEHFINDDAFRKVFLKAESEIALSDSEIVMVYSYHFNTYLKWQWEWQQLAATDPDQVPLHQWGHYLRVYPLTLEAWEWRKSHFQPEFAKFFEETLEPDSRRVE